MRWAATRRPHKAKRLTQDVSVQHLGGHRERGRIPRGDAIGVRRRIARRRARVPSEVGLERAAPVIGVDLQDLGHACDRVLVIVERGVRARDRFSNARSSAQREMTVDRPRRVRSPVPDSTAGRVRSPVPDSAARRVRSPVPDSAAVCSRWLVPGSPASRLIQRPGAGPLAEARATRYRPTSPRIALPPSPTARGETGSKPEPVLTEGGAACEVGAQRPGPALGSTG